MKIKTTPTILMELVRVWTKIFSIGRALAIGPDTNIEAITMSKRPQNTRSDFFFTIPLVFMEIYRYAAGIYTANKNASMTIKITPIIRPTINIVKYVITKIYLSRPLIILFSINVKKIPNPIIWRVIPICHR